MIILGQFHVPTINVGHLAAGTPTSDQYSDLLTYSDKITPSDANHQCIDIKKRERGYGEQKQQVGTRPLDKRKLCVENKMNESNEALGKMKESQRECQNVL